MSGTQIVDGIKMNVESIGYQAPKTNPAGGKNVRLSYNKNNSTFLVSTPLMLTWGVNEYVDDKTGKKSYDLSLQFPREEYATKDTTAFLDALKGLEENIKHEATTRCKEWFNKTKMSSDVVDALWTPMLRYPKDKDTGEFDYSRAPTLRVKLPFWDNAFTSEIYNLEGEALFPSESSALTPPELITKGCNLAAVLQNGGIWFANGKFGTTWKLFQAMIKPKATLRGKCHISLTAEDKERMEKSVAPEENVVAEDSDDEAPAANSHVVAADSEESDAEEEPVRDPTPEPAPAPKKIKKVVRKKTAA
jgi:hypothetical protein